MDRKWHTILQKQSIIMSPDYLGSGKPPAKFTECWGVRKSGVICVGKHLEPCTFVQIIEGSSLFSRPRPAFFNATDRKVNGCLMIRKSVIQELGLWHPAYYASTILNMMIVSGLVQITSMNVFEQKANMGC